jgi:hypothetical protein
MKGQFFKLPFLYKKSSFVYPIFFKNSMFTHCTIHWYRRMILFCGILLLFLSAQSCRISPITPIEETQQSFTPTLEWLQITRGVVMDVSESGTIVSAGDTTIGFNRNTVISNFNPEGERLYYILNDSQNGLVREILDNYQDRVRYIFLADIWENLGAGMASFVYSIDGSRLTPVYTRYDAASGAPDTDPYPWSGYRYVVGPSIAKGPKRTKTIRSSEQYLYYSRWFVGSFTDQFVSAPSTTQGKADCFVRRYEDEVTPVRHQWGGTENDLAYDVASDDTGNPTIFLRAGSEFGITSATQSLVRMQRGYNIVTLDTNGLLTKTYAVPLQATGEIMDPHIALGKNRTVFICAFDVVRQQFFLAKAAPSGLVWTRYFDKSVGEQPFLGLGRESRMDLCVDSKDNVYLTGVFGTNVSFGEPSSSIPDSLTSLKGSTGEAFVVKYSTNNQCLGALKMGAGMGCTIRLAPDEQSLYVNGWSAGGNIMGVRVPRQDDPRNGVLRPGAFLVKLKLGK